MCGDFFFFAELLKTRKEGEEGARISKNCGRGFVSKTLKIFIYRYSYTSTLHALDMSLRV